MAIYRWGVLDIPGLQWGGSPGGGETTTDAAVQIAAPWSLQRCILDVGGWGFDQDRNTIAMAMWGGCHGSVILQAIGATDVLYPIFDFDVVYNFAETQLYLPGVGPQDGYYSKVFASIANPIHADANARIAGSRGGPSGFTLDLRVTLDMLSPGSGQWYPDHWVTTFCHARVKYLMSQPS